MRFLRKIFGVVIPKSIIKPWYCKFCKKGFATVEVKIIDRWSRVCPDCECIVLPVDELTRAKEMLRRIFN